MSGGVLGKNQKDISSAKEWPLKKWPPTLARVGGHGQRSHGLQSSTLRRVGDDWSTLVSHIPYWYQWYLDVISHLTSLCVMRLEIWCRKLKEESSNFAHTAVLWDAIAPQSSFQTKVWSESSFCHALRCWYKLEIEIGLISSLNRVRGGIPSLLFAFHVLMTSKSEFCSQVACANLLNRRHDWKGTEKLLLDLLAIKKKMFFNVARVFRWLNHFCCHQFSRFNLFPWTRKMAKPNSQQQVGASLLGGCTLHVVSETGRTGYNCSPNLYLQLWEVSIAPRSAQRQPFHLLSASSGNRWLSPQRIDGQRCRKMLLIQEYRPQTSPK